MEPLENDLYKINVRNYSESGTVAPDAIRFDGDSFNADNKRDTYSNYNEQENSRRYSVFDMSKSYYSDQGEFSSSSKLGIDNSKTVGKNKTAFFRKTGVLIRD